ncbi:MAG: LEPR-XLL domain-containing protein [Planctomycetes bacterium]|nr:LEPR-XLL domain-containing protein [Planctomycetota bacterium]
MKAGVSSTQSGRQRRCRVCFHGIEPLEPRVLLSGGAGPSIVNDVNDSGWTATHQILAGEPIGQTFKAISDNRLATVAMHVADMNASSAPARAAATG